jgi:hypothetical protein
MSEFEEIPAQGVDAQPAGEGLPEMGEPTASTEYAIRDGDPFADVAEALEGNPRKEELLQHLQSIAGERDELGAALEGMHGYQEWVPAIDALAEQYGVTPDLVLEYLQNPQPHAQMAQEVDPQIERAQRLGEYLEGRGIHDWTVLTPAEQAALLESFELREWRGQQEAERQAWEEHQRQGEIQMRIQRVHQEYPEFQSGKLTNALRVFAEAGLDPIECAHDLRSEIDGMVQSHLARYYEQKAADADFPVAPGGSSPLPRELQNYHDLPDRDRREVISRFLQAAQAQT